MCRDCFDSLSDGQRCGEDCSEMGCEFFYNQNRVRVVGSQLFRAAGNTETVFSDHIYTALLTA